MQKETTFASDWAQVSVFSSLRPKNIKFDRRRRFSVSSHLSESCFNSEDKEAISEVGGGTRDGFLDWFVSVFFSRTSTRVKRLPITLSMLVWVERIDASSFAIAVWASWRLDSLSARFSNVTGPIIESGPGFNSTSPDIIKSRLMRWLVAQYSKRDLYNDLRQQSSNSGGHDTANKNGSLERTQKAWGT